MMRRAAAEGLGRAKDQSAFEALQAQASTDESGMVRAAIAFALKLLDRGHVVRLVDFMHSAKTVPQVQGYLQELGPSVVPDLLPRLQEPGETMRRSVVDAIGALGDHSTVASLEPLLQDRDGDVVKAATRAIERIKMRTAGT
jgi:HEAT repeat protein